MAQPELIGGETEAKPPSDDFAAALRGFGPAGILAIVVILFGNVLFLPASALLVLAWAWRSHTPWREIGFVRPRSWIVTITVGIVFGIALKLLMKALVLPLLGVDPVNQAYHYLAGNQSAIPSALYALIVGAAFGEEVVFRGWMFERFGKLLGHHAVAKIATVLITALWFGLDHYANQGLPGVEQGVIVGLVFGTIMAVTGQLWLLIFAHAAFDLTAYAMIYWNLESAVAHLIFK